MSTCRISLVCASSRSLRSFSGPPLSSVRAAWQRLSHVSESLRSSSRTDMSPKPKPILRMRTTRVYRALAQRSVLQTSAYAKLVDNMQYNLIVWLVDTFKVILIPRLELSRMVKKKGLAQSAGTGWTATHPPRET